VSRISAWYTCPVLRKAKRKSVRLEASLVTEAQRATGAKSGTEAVRSALEELVERVRFRKWVRKVAGKGMFPGHERES
jgi:Arc/MetJ family transcription regulator